MSRIRVLVVDDDPWILRMVSSSLEKKGSYIVETARDGQQALRKAQAQRPDMVITDVMMPVMDGWALAQQLRADSDLAAVPVLFLTALGKDEDRLHALGLQPEDYVSKPFRFDELERRVLKILAARGLVEEPVRGGPGLARAGGFVQPGFAQPGPGRAFGPQPGFGPRAGFDARPASAPAFPGRRAGDFGPPPAGFPAKPGHGPAGGYAPRSVPNPPAQVPPMPVAPSSAGVPEDVDPGSSGSFTGAMKRTGLSGRLEQLGLSSLLVMMEMERKDGVLQLQRGADKLVGRIFLRAGRVIQSRIDDEAQRDGRTCVYEMLTWNKGRFHFAAMEVDMEDEVQASTTSLLMEGARLIDEANR